MRTFITPNQISSVRVLLTPVIFYLILYPITDPFVQTYITGSLFLMVCLSDFLDGYLARKFKQESILGKILDPLADKMLIMTGFVGLLAIGQMNAWAVFIILSREFLVTGIRVILATQNLSITSSFIGKTKTVVQMFAIGFSIMQWFPAKWLVLLAVIITLYSGIEYAIKAFKSLKHLEH